MVPTMSSLACLVRWEMSDGEHMILRALRCSLWDFVAGGFCIFFALKVFVLLLSRAGRPGDRGRPPNRTCAKCNLLQVMSNLVP